MSFWAHHFREPVFCDLAGRATKPVVIPQPTILSLLGAHHFGEPVVFSWCRVDGVISHERAAEDSGPPREDAACQIQKSRLTRAWVREAGPPVTGTELFTPLQEW